MVCPTQKQEKASYVMYLLEQLEQLRQKCEGGYFGSLLSEGKNEGHGLLHRWQALESRTGLIFKFF